MGFAKGGWVAVEIAEGEYRNGEKTGFWREAGRVQHGDLNPNSENFGVKMHQGRYKKGSKHGTWREWDEDNFLMMVEYRNGTKPRSTGKEGGKHDLIKE